MIYKSSRPRPASQRAIYLSALILAFTAIVLTVVAYRKDSVPVKNSLISTAQNPVKRATRATSAPKPVLVAAALPPVRKSSTVSSNFILKSPVNKPDQVITEAAAATVAGDPAAMRYTAEALHACAFADMRDDGSLRNKAVADAAALENALAAAGTSFAPGSEPSSHVDQVTEDKATMRDSCSKVSTDDAKAWLTMLKSAAASGDQTAKLEYAQFALGELSENDKRDERAEYMDRRETAFDNLTDLVADGDCSEPVLEQLQVASPNATIKYIYGSMRLQQIAQLVAANTKLSPANVATAQSYLRREQTGMSALIPEDQVNAADSAAAYIAQNYCSG